MRVLGSVGAGEKPQMEGQRRRVEEELRAELPGIDEGCSARIMEELEQEL